MEYKDKNVTDYANLITKALPKGILLNTSADKFNSMVIGWGHILWRTRILSVNESTISGILLHDPNQSFKCNKGAIVEFRLQETDDNKLVRVKIFE